METWVSTAANVIPTSRPALQSPIFSIGITPLLESQFTVITHSKCKEKVVKLDEVTKEHKNTNSRNCSKHPDQVIKMNCTVCNVTICKDHDTHTSESLDSALDRYRIKKIPKLKTERR